MLRARFVFTAVAVEGLSQGEAARRYGVCQGWVSRLPARYRAEGPAAFEPRSRRPGTSPSAVAAGTAELIVRLRKELAGQGPDAGPRTIAWHLEHRHRVTVPAATVSRYLARAGLVVPGPANRPGSSCPRFEADMPNGCRPSGFTRYPLAGGTGRTHAATRTLLLNQNLPIRVINAATGQLLRDLTLDPARNYQPTGKPRGGSRPRN